MGSKSSSSSASTNNQRQVTQDASQNEGVAVTTGGNAEVTVVDGGAFDFAETIGLEAFDFGEGVFSAALDAVSGDKEEQFQNQAELLSSVAEAGRSETSQALDKITTYFFATIALVAGVYFWSKTR